MYCKMVSLRGRTAAYFNVQIYHPRGGTERNHKILLKVVGTPLDIEQVM